MRCQKCVAVKARHGVVEEDRSNVGGGKPQRYWDEQDREHVHDPRWDLVYYRCSIGHTFSQPSAPIPCPVPTCEFAKRMQQSIEAEMARRAGTGASSGKA